MYNLNIMLSFSLNPKPSILNPQRGFTLIELLVVLGIMAMLSSIAIIYSRTGEQQIFLFKEQAKVVSVILRAKSLALQTFAESATAGVCGYGAHFVGAPDNQFILFKDLAASGSDCGTADHRYSGPAEDFEVNKLENNLKFAPLDLTDIVFVPPDPLVVLNPPLVPPQTSVLIKITTLDNVSEVKIKVSNAGQVTTQ